MSRRLSSPPSHASPSPQGVMMLAYSENNPERKRVLLESQVPLKYHHPLFNNVLGDAVTQTADHTAESVPLFCAPRVPPTLFQVPSWACVSLPKRDQEEEVPCGVNPMDEKEIAWFQPCFSYLVFQRRLERTPATLYRDPLPCYWRYKGIAVIPIGSRVYVPADHRKRIYDILPSFLGMKARGVLPVTNDPVLFGRQGDLKCTTFLCVVTAFVNRFHEMFDAQAQQHGASVRVLVCPRSNAYVVFVVPTSEKMRRALMEPAFHSDSSPNRDFLCEQLKKYATVQAEKMYLKGNNADRATDLGFCEVNEPFIPFNYSPQSEAAAELLPPDTVLQFPSGGERQCLPRLVEVKTVSSHLTKQSLEFALIFPSSSAYPYSSTSTAIGESSGLGETRERKTGRSIFSDHTDDPVVPLASHHAGSALVCGVPLCTSGTLTISSRDPTQVSTVLAYVQVRSCGKHFRYLLPFNKPVELGHLSCTSHNEFDLVIRAGPDAEVTVHFDQCFFANTTRSSSSPPAHLYNRPRLAIDEFFLLGVVNAFPSPATPGEDGDGTGRGCRSSRVIEVKRELFQGMLQCAREEIDAFCTAAGPHQRPPVGVVNKKQCPLYHPKCMETLLEYAGYRVLSVLARTSATFRAEILKGQRQKLRRWFSCLTDPVTIPDTALDAFGIKSRSGMTDCDLRHIAFCYALAVQSCGFDLSSGKCRSFFCDTPSADTTTRLAKLSGADVRRFLPLHYWMQCCLGGNVGGSSNVYLSDLWNPYWGGVLALCKLWEDIPLSNRNRGFHLCFLKKTFVSQYRYSPSQEDKPKNLFYLTPEAKNIFSWQFQHYERHRNAALYPLTNVLLRFPSFLEELGQVELPMYAFMTRHLEYHFGPRVLFQDFAAHFSHVQTLSEVSENVSPHFQSSPSKLLLTTWQCVTSESPLYQRVPGLLSHISCFSPRLAMRVYGRQNIPGSRKLTDCPLASYEELLFKRLASGDSYAPTVLLAHEVGSGPPTPEEGGVAGCCGESVPSWSQRNSVDLTLFEVFRCASLLNGKLVKVVLRNVVADTHIRVTPSLVVKLVGEPGVSLWHLVAIVQLRRFSYLSGVDNQGNKVPFLTQCAKANHWSWIPTWLQIFLPPRDRVAQTRLKLDSLEWQHAGNFPCVSPLDSPLLRVELEELSGLVPENKRKVKISLSKALERTRAASARK